jgi:hypothetical protein
MCYIISFVIAFTICAVLTASRGDLLEWLIAMGIVFAGIAIIAIPSPRRSND